MNHSNYGITNESITEERLRAIGVLMDRKITKEDVEALMKLGTGPLQAKIRVVAYAPCRLAAHRQRARLDKTDCDCKDRKVIGVREGMANLCTNVFASFVQANILNQAPANNQSDTGGSSRAITANTAMSSLTGEAGTSATTAAVTDTKLGTATESQASVTVNANPTSGTTSGTFTVTFTITAGADRAYAEVGLYVTKQTFVFCITRDTFSVLNVSNTGTLAVTYTFTNS